MDDEGDDVVDYDWIDGLDLDVDSASLLLPIDSSLDNNASEVGAENHDDDEWRMQEGLSVSYEHSFPNIVAR